MRTLAEIDGDIRQSASGGNTNIQIMVHTGMDEPEGNVIEHVSSDE